MQRFYEDYLGRLQGLHAGVEQAIADLPVSALDWQPGPEMNSLAVLIYHFTGAERYWIGDVAGGQPSGRDRASEFQVRGLEEAALRRRMADTLAHSRSVVEHLSLADLEAERVSPRDGQTFTVGDALLHALEHTALHAGHGQMVRQMLDEHREAWFTFTVPEQE